MTTPMMIALTVIVVVFLISILIMSVFLIVDYFNLKECHHFCILCKYKHKCDWYLQNKKNLK